jgi:hypothetical protein
VCVCVRARVRAVGFRRCDCVAAGSRFQLLYDFNRRLAACSASLNKVDRHTYALGALLASILFRGTQHSSIGLSSNIAFPDYRPFSTSRLDVHNYALQRRTIFTKCNPLRLFTSPIYRLLAPKSSSHRFG